MWPRSSAVCEGLNPFRRETYRKTLRAKYFWEVDVEEKPTGSSRNWGQKQIRERVGTVIYSGNFTIWTRVVVVMVVVVVVAISWLWFADLVAPRAQSREQNTLVNFPHRCRKWASVRPRATRWRQRQLHRKSTQKRNAHKLKPAGRIPRQVYFPTDSTLSPSMNLKRFTFMSGNRRAGINLIN